MHIPLILIKLLESQSDYTLFLLFYFRCHTQLHTEYASDAMIFFYFLQEEFYHFIFFFNLIFIQVIVIVGFLLSLI